MRYLHVLWHDDDEVAVLDLTGRRVLSGTPDEVDDALHEALRQLHSESSR